MAERAGESRFVIDWEDNDELFYEELSAGHRWATHVANEMNERHVRCHVKPMEFRENLDDRDRFENEQDITFDIMSGCVEVKSRRLHFTHDPRSFPYGTAFVDTVAGWEKKQPKPLAVVLVSQLTKAMIVVPTSTKGKWGTKRSFDRVRNIEESWYVVNRTQLRSFDDLVAWLLARQSSGSPVR